LHPAVLSTDDQHVATGVATSPHADAVGVDLGPGVANCGALNRVSVRWLFQIAPRNSCICGDRSRTMTGCSARWWRTTSPQPRRSLSENQAAERQFRSSLRLLLWVRS